MTRRKPKPRQPQRMTEAERLLAQGLVRDKQTGLLLSAHNDDTGPAERAQHGLGVTVKRHYVTEDRHVSERTGALAVDECLFETLVGRGAVADPLPADAGRVQRDRAEAILDRRITAAQWLRRLWTETGLAQRVSGSYTIAGTRSHGGAMSDRDAEAQQLFRAIWPAIGPRRADLLAAVVCHQQLPAGATAPALREALDRLAAWRGL